MTSRADLEQDLSIAEAELEQKQKENFELAREVERLRGENQTIRDAAGAAGVALALPSTPMEQERQALEHVRAGISEDLQALDELRNPPAIAERPETPLEIVRANQRERAELQARSARSNAIVSRVAAAVRIDQWDDEGSQIVERVNHLGTLQLRVERKLKELRKGNTGGDTVSIVHWIAALEWVLNTAAEKAKVDPKKARIINFVVVGQDTPVDAQPEQTLGYLVGIALVRAQCTDKPAREWMLFAEDGARLNHDMIASELAGSKVVVTLPVGVGA